jgi:N-methylhydantoinase A
MARSVHGLAMTGAEMRAIFAALVVGGRDWLAAQTPAGQKVEERIEYWADIRYRGQSFELTVPVSAPAAAAGDLDEVVAAFHGEHRRLYTHADQSKPVEFIELRIRIRGVLPAPQASFPVAPPAAGAESLVGHRALRVEADSFDRVPIHDCALIAPDVAVAGPAVIEQADATILVPPGYVAKRTGGGEVVLTRQEA